MRQNPSPECYRQALSEEILHGSCRWPACVFCHATWKKDFPTMVRLLKKKYGEAGVASSCLRRTVQPLMGDSKGGVRRKRAHAVVGPSNPFALTIGMSPIDHIPTTALFIDGRKKAARGPLRLGFHGSLNRNAPKSPITTPSVRKARRFRRISGFLRHTLMQGAKDIATTQV